MKDKEDKWIAQSDELIDKLIKKEKFSFARYGDGEMNCIFGLEGHNCDGHDYFPDMGKRLELILDSDPTYYLGEAAIARRYWGDEIDITKAAHPGLSWINADCLHLRSIADTIWPFFDALKKRDVVMVAPEKLRKHSLFLNAFVPIPEQNCWLEYEHIHKEISKYIFNEDVVVVYCASMMANVLIDDFSPLCTNIDLGSLIDPYMGFMTRSHHAKIKNL